MIEITDRPLEPDAITATVRDDSNGAVVTFLGATRDTSQDRKVLHLEYEAYRPMADKKLAEIVDEIRMRWRIDHMAISHRIGRLEIGEISLVVAVASPHRKEAFTACHEAVDRIKQIVPIWKKEFFVGRSGSAARKTLPNRRQPARLRVSGPDALPNLLIALAPWKLRAPSRS